MGKKDKNNGGIKRNDRTQENVENVDKEINWLKSDMLQGIKTWE